MARLDGRVVFVAGAVPGERVRATITRRTGNVAWAETLEVIEASPDRREPPCDPRCGGSLYAHINYERQLQLKAEVVADAFRRIAKHPLSEPVPVTSSPEEGYRLRARLQVQGSRLGFLLEGTHTLCDAEATRQLSPAAFGALNHLRETLGPLLATCDAVSISEGIAARQRVALCELGRHADPAAFAGLVLPEGLTGVAVITNRGMFTCAGEDRIVEEGLEVLGFETEVRWSRQAGSFFQGNRFLVSHLTRRVMELSAGDYFADLYAGVGLFSLALASQGSSGVAVEGDALSGQDLTENSAQAKGRLTVRVEPVETAVASPLHRQPDVVIVDPPRTGMSPEVVRGLLQWQSPRLVYVSCDVPTLARDSALLTGGGYRLSSLEALDMFPNTPHVECIAVFDR